MYAYSNRGLSGSLARSLQLLELALQSDDLMSAPWSPCQLTSSFFLFAFSWCSLIWPSTRLLSQSASFGRDPAYISDLMNSSRFSTFALASVGSCSTSAGPTSLKIVLSAFNVLNS